MSGMTIPNLPTDNLYKFIALSGVALVLSVLYLSVTSMADADRQIMDTGEQIEMASVHSKALSHRVEELQKIISNSINLQNGTYKIDKNKLQITYSDDEIKQSLRTIDELIEQAELVGEKLRAAHYRDTVLLRNLEKIKIATGIGMFVGTLMTYWGFRLWYVRVQKIQDRLLSIELDTSQAIDRTGT